MTSALNTVTEALVKGLMAELKIDEARARYVVECALNTKLERPVYSLEGKGLFLRRQSDHDPVQIGQHFNWICAQIINQARQRPNRDLEWYRRANAAGCEISMLDVLPTPTAWRTGLADAIEFSARANAKAYVIDAEVEFKNHRDEAIEYVAEARRLCSSYNLQLGFTSYGSTGAHGTFPWEVFCKGTDFSIIQTYDRDGVYDPSYMPSSIEEYREKGAARIILGLGAFVRDDAHPSGRWRTADEEARHLALVPPGVASVIFWPPVGGIVGRDIMAAIDAWRPAADSTTRDLLSSLTPFGRFSRS